MIFNFINPIYLCLLPFAVLFVIFVSKNKIFESKFSKWFVLTTRIIIFILLILALSGISVKNFTELTTTVFTADISASMKGTNNKMLEFINKSLQYKSSNDYTGLVCFAEKPMVERIPVKEQTEYNITTFIENDFTNISEALNLSRSLFAEDTKKRILLLSDGQENILSSLQTAKTLKQQGITIDVLPIENVINDEVQITNLSIPKYINKDTKYNIEVIIDSFIDTKSKFILYKQNNVIFDKEIDIKKGENRFVVSDIADDGGSIIYHAEIQPKNDTIYENNIFYGYSYVDDIPNVLIVEKNKSGEEIKRILEGSKINVKETEASMAPTKIELLNTYDAVIIANVSIDDMPKEFPDILESYVKNSAGGVFVTGGEDAFALGGYKDTKIEELLPVEMDLKDKDNIPNLGLVILVDRSGSMSSGEYGVSKLQLAKESVIRSAETITENDSIGVLAFDDGFHWAVNFQKAENNKDNIIASIAKITEGGGTSILPALKEAVNVLKDSDTKLKHIILLTDGQAEQEGYNNLLEEIRERNITLSTVAVGSGSDEKLLKRLSEQGNGRYYYTDEFTDLPKIFAKETFMAGKSYINNRTFYPNAEDMSSILNGIEQLPSLDGYITTTGKSRADILLTSDTKEPILSTWQYGLGRSAAWTSDAQKWINNWFSADEGVNIFRNTVSWIIRKQMLSDVSVDIQPKGKTSDIIVNVSQNEDIENIEGNIVGNGVEYKTEFNIISPGKFKAEIPASSQGTYIVNLQLSAKEKNKDSFITTGVNIPYSPEFDIRNFKSGSALLSKIAELTGGRVIKDPKEVFLKLQDNVYAERNLSDLFLIISIILLIFDIALRRFPVINYKIESIFKRKKINKENKDFKNSVSSMYNSNTEKNENKKSSNDNDKKTVKKDNKEKKSTTSSLLVDGKKKRSNR